MTVVWRRQILKQGYDSQKLWHRCSVVNIKGILADVLISWSNFAQIVITEAGSCTLPIGVR